MNRDRLVLGLAAVFAGMTVLMVVLAAAFRDPVPLFVALAFGAATYTFWYRASGRLRERAARARRHVGPGAGGRPSGGGQADGGRGGFGAGPREEWTPPGGDARWRAARDRAGGREQGADTGAAAGARPRSRDEPTAAEARRVLGVDAHADEADIRRAYRRKVKETHPDTESGDEEAFKRVNAAYERLTD